jgi:lysophospholipase L1-like esterase
MDQLLTIPHQCSPKYLENSLNLGDAVASQKRKGWMPEFSAAERSRMSISLLIVFLMGGISVSFAQPIPATFQRGVQKFPCRQTIPPGHQLNLDFGQLCRYEDENAKLPPPTDHRVIYFGDSLTELWGRQIPGLQSDDVINRGISGQTTAQMLVRFRSDVINLKPRVVHLLMGTNDIAGNTGATSVARIEDAIKSMAEQAHANGIRVVLASILPAKTIPWRQGIDPVPAIHEINRWLESYAAKEGFTYVDYYSRLKDGGDGFTTSLTRDGVHPNASGYAVMNPLAADAVQRANRQ